jgi:thiol-disulfide isomerase/thioredoxin
LREGYKLIGDSAAANALPPPDKKSSPRTFHADYDAWSKAHPYPTANTPPQEADKFHRELVEASAQWVKDWPDDPSARQWRLSSLAEVKSTPNEELEKAGDALLNTLKQHPFKGFMLMPFQATVAEIWGERNIRPERCLQLADEALAEIDRSAKANPAFAKTHEYMVLNGRFDTLTIEAEAARKVKNFEKARAALDQIKRGLDETSGDYTRARHSYLSQSALLAEAEGHKLDALTYDRLLFSQFPTHSDEEAHALALWKGMGGTDEAFKLWSSLEQPKKPNTVNDASPWAETNKPLTTLNASDVNSRTWAMADLKGKTTLITVWATWCAPCRAELPALQTLFEQLKDRKDVQVISIGVDENPGVIAPFLKENHYTFPVLFARSTLIDDLDGLGGIPRNWIVDSNGSLRFERLRYKPADWPQEILQKMTALSLHP